MAYTRTMACGVTVNACQHSLRPIYHLTPPPSVAAPYWIIWVMHIQKRKGIVLQLT